MFPWKFNIHLVDSKSIPALETTSRHMKKREDEDVLDIAAAAMDAIRVDDGEAEDLSCDD